MIQRVHPQKDRVITLIAATCGLRIGEILGLTWNDIDLKSSTLKVNEQWKKLKDGTIGFGDVKTKNSNRVVPLPPTAFSELIKYKKTAQTDLNKRLFLDKVTQSTANRLYYKYRRLGYDVSIHDLKHTYVTMLIGNGIDLKTVAKFLGHTIKITMKTYSHVNSDMINTAINTINIISN
ncbi:integrase [Brassicibacter mesophilus]